MEQDEISITPDREPEAVGGGNDSDDNEEYSVEDDTWIEWFCKMEGNHFFVEISHDFIKDKNNYYGLERIFPDYEKYIDIILSNEAPTSDILNEDYMDKIVKIKELYGILHSRFIFSSIGMSLVREKFLNGIYGVCPRILCHKQTVLPYGISDDLKYARIFCPSCQDIYKPRGNVQEMDGAYFGPNLPQAFLMYFKDLNYFKQNQKFVPKLYGFKIYGKEGSKKFKK